MTIVHGRRHDGQRKIIRALMGSLGCALLLGGCAVARSSTVRVYTTPGDPLVAAAVRYIAQSQRSLDLALRDVASPQIAEALRDAHARGVAIRLVTDAFSLERPRHPNEDVSEIPGLQAAGIPVKVLGTPHVATMHHKFAIADGRTLWVGSWNWRTRDALANWEDVLVMDDPATVRRLTDVFEALWQAP